MNCPRCECHIADGFYCIGCGYVPTQIDARTNTNAPILDIINPQASRGILNAPRPIMWLTGRRNLSILHSLIEHTAGLWVRMRWSCLRFLRAILRTEF